LRVKTLLKFEGAGAAFEKESVGVTAQMLGKN
jgi:hypothetical protein